MPKRKKTETDISNSEPASSNKKAQLPHPIRDSEAFAAKKKSNARTRAAESEEWTEEEDKKLWDARLINVAFKDIADGGIVDRTFGACKARMITLRRKANNEAGLPEDGDEDLEMLDNEDAEEVIPIKRATASANAASGNWSKEEDKKLWDARLKNTPFKAIADGKIVQRSEGACKGRMNVLKEMAGEKSTKPSDDEEDLDAREESTVKKKRQKKAAVDDIENLSARQARLFLDVRPSMREGLPFTQLEPNERFMLGDVVEDYFIGMKFLREVPNNTKLAPLTALLTMALNDYQSHQEGAVGRFQCDHKGGQASKVRHSNRLYFMLRKFPVSDQEEYRRSSPQRRLHMSGPYIHFHCSSPLTQLLPVLPFVTSDSEKFEASVFELELTTKLWDARNSNDGPLLFLVTCKRIFVATMRDLAQSHAGRAPEIGSCSGYYRHKGKVKIVWTLNAEAVDSFWTDGKAITVEGGGDAGAAEIVSCLADWHYRVLDNENDRNGVGLVEFGDLMEDLFQGE